MVKDLLEHSLVPIAQECLEIFIKGIVGLKVEEELTIEENMGVEMRRELDVVVR